MVPNANCCFCHLFFACPFTKSIWYCILDLSYVGYCIRPWGEYVAKLASKWKGNKLKFAIGKLCLGATIYWIWREMNSRIFGGECRDKSNIIHSIKCVVRERAMGIQNFRFSHTNWVVADTWSLPQTIFKNSIDDHGNDG